ncbi:sensor histidine kinase [Paenibacillus sp. 2TAB26]
MSCELPCETQSIMERSDQAADHKNTNQFVSIAHELELVQAYLYIEKERFAERLEIVWEVHRNIDCR